MRIPPADKMFALLKFFSIFGLGLICGCALYLSIHHHHFNLIYVAYHKALEENEKLHQDLASLQKYQHSQSRVSMVRVHYINEEDPVPFTEDVKVEIERIVKKELKPLLGQKASYLKEVPWLCEKLIANKPFWVHGKRLFIEVKSMIFLHNELIIYIRAMEKVDFPNNSR